MSDQLLNDRLWTIADVAAYFVVSDTQAEWLTAQPGFPAPRVVPSRGRGERRTKRWKPDAVKAWADTLEKAA